MLSEKMELSKKRIYEIVEVSSKNDKASHSYDSMIHVAVVVGLLPLTMKNEDVFTRGIDLLSAIIFLVDYLLRLCTSDYKMGVKSYKAYIAYVLTPMAIIDMLSIIPLLTIYVLSESPLYHNFGYIFLGFSPFPRRTHRVRTAGMSLSKKNLSQNSCIKRLRENIYFFMNPSSLECFVFSECSVC